MKAGKRLQDTVSGPDPGPALLLALAMPQRQALGSLYVSTLRRLSLQLAASHSNVVIEGCSRQLQLQRKLSVSSKQRSTQPMRPAI